MNLTKETFNKLEFIRDYLDKHPEIKISDSDGYRSVPIYLYELNNLLIKIMINEDISQIKEDIINGDYTFLEDVLKGEYFTPYCIYEKEKAHNIISEFLNRNFTENPEYFIEELNRFWREKTSTEETVSSLVKLVDLVYRHYTELPALQKALKAMLKEIKKEVGTIAYRYLYANYIDEDKLMLDITDSESSLEHYSENLYCEIQGWICQIVDKSTMCLHNLLIKYYLPHVENTISIINYVKNQVLDLREINLEEFKLAIFDYATDFSNGSNYTIEELEDLWIKKDSN